MTDRMKEIKEYIKARCKDEKAFGEVWAVYHDSDLHATNFSFDCYRLQEENKLLKEEIERIKNERDSSNAR